MIKDELRQFVRSTLKGFIRQAEGQSQFLIRHFTLMAFPLMTRSCNQALLKHSNPFLQLPRYFLYMSETAHTNT